MISRTIEQSIKGKLFGKKAIILLGPRQTGKSTLLTKICDEQDDYLLLLCDDPEVRESLTNKGEAHLRQLIGNHKIVLIDEAQRVENIGITLKIIVDRMPDVQLLVSGSSALELNDSINEPLTGRKWEYRLYPISIREIIEHYGLIEAKGRLLQSMTYGLYPDVVNHPGEEVETLRQLSDSYLYKDILSIDSIRKPALIEKLLRALALQIGSEVSYSELGRLLEADKNTIITYIDLLKKAFIIFELPSFARNKRNEIRHGKKFYFYDIGIRNAIISDFRDLSLRTDTGAIWENFVIAELMKENQYKNIHSDFFFWRNTTQNEIDLIEERNGEIYAYEIKWSSSKKPRIPIAFQKTYPNAKYSIINKTNFFDLYL